MLLALVSCDLEIKLLPARVAAHPAGLAGETEEGLFLRPALLRRNIWEIGGAIATAAIVERQADAVGAHDPVIWVINLLEVGQECHSYLERRQLAARYGREAGVVQSRNEGILGDARGEWERLESADAATEARLVIIVIVIKSVPCDKQRSGC